MMKKEQRFFFLYFSFSKMRVYGLIGLSSYAIFAELNDDLDGFLQKDSRIINAYLTDIARKGDINLIMKGKLGIIAREMNKGKLDFFAIKHAIEEAIVECNLKEKIEKVYLYGSYARGEATDKSDIDLRLVTHDISLFEIGYFGSEIKEKTGKDVDVSNEKPEKLDPNFYANVKKDEVCIYERS